VNAADIDSRVKQLDQTTQQLEEGEKSKAGFWEEFDVRPDPASLMFLGTVSDRDAFVRKPQGRPEVGRSQRYFSCLITNWSPRLLSCVTELEEFYHHPVVPVQYYMILHRPYSFYLKHSLHTQKHL